MVVGVSMSFESYGLYGTMPLKLAAPRDDLMPKAPWAAAGAQMLPRAFQSESVTRTMWRRKVEALLSVPRVKSSQSYDAMAAALPALLPLVVR